MATSQDVVLAILALDVYNEDYSPGMTLPNKTSIDGATIVGTDGDTIAQQSSFYAVAYNWDGETVISYRGTRADGLIGPDSGDILYGWTVSAGYAQASQAQLALQFYNKITSPDAANVILTGHSLGGALAGFVADVEGEPADIFDNMAFGSAVVAEAGEYAQSQGLALTLPNALSELSVSSSAKINQFISYLQPSRHPLTPTLSRRRERGRAAEWHLRRGISDDAASPSPACGRRWPRSGRMRVERTAGS
jgi:hypothetical protein